MRSFYQDRLGINIGKTQKRLPFSQVFYSQHPDGSVNPASAHGGCPVLGGQTKWAANLWVWNAQRFKTGSTANPDGEGAPHIPNPNLKGEADSQHSAATAKAAADDLSERKVSAQFVNEMSAPVALWWRKHDGSYKHIAQIQPGQTSGMTTYHGT